MKKPILYMALLFAASTAQAQTPQQIAQKFYPKYSQEYQRYQVDVKDNGQYCVRRTKSGARQTTQGRLIYLLLTGNVLNFGEGIVDGTHVQSGLAGVFVLKQTSDNWKLLAAQPHGWAGSLGSASETKSRSLHKFDKDKWGFLTLHGDVHNGHAGFAYQLFVHGDAKKIAKSSITTEAKNTGTLGDCSENFYKGHKNTATKRRKCLNELYNLSSKIKILRDGKTNAGLYPFQLTVSDSDGSRKYASKVFIAIYNSIGGYHSTPRDYLLVDKDL